MGDAEDLTRIIGELYELVGELERKHPGRHFTLDGHLVGSIGEVFAAERYGIELFIASTETHDGKAPDGRRVQIKATQRSSIGITSEPECLIVLRIDEKGELEEVYNGPGKPVWALVTHRKRPKTGQYQISLSKLRELDERVALEDKIPSLYE